MVYKAQEGAGAAQPHLACAQTRRLAVGTLSWLQAQEEGLPTSQQTPHPGAGDVWAVLVEEADQCRVVVKSLADFSLQIKLPRKPKLWLQISL